MLNDTIKAKGRLTICLFAEDGSLKEEVNVDNLVVQLGKNFITSRMVDTTKAAMSNMAVGSGSVTPTSSDSALGSELGRVALTSSNYSANVVTYVATFGAGVGTGALTEAGIFNAASAGTMLARTTFSVINKGASDTITITWSVTIQ